LNLQTNQFNLHKVLTNELTNKSVRCLRNRWKWTYKHISWNSKNRRNKLTNRVVHLSSDVDTVKDELTHRSIILFRWQRYRWTYKQISSYSKGRRNKLINILVYFRVEKDEFTNRLVHLVQNREKSTYNQISSFGIE
jgi:cytoplasmic iron level regulating protein YaaA (DUF328/UPF0246 family)